MLLQLASQEVFCSLFCCAEEHLPTKGCVQFGVRKYELFLRSRASSYEALRCMYSPAPCVIVSRFVVALMTLRCRKLPNKSGSLGLHTGGFSWRTLW